MDKQCKQIEELREEVELWKKASENNSYKAFKFEQENAELKERNKELLESCEGATMMYKDLCKAKEIIKKLKALYLYPVVTNDDIKRQDEILEEAEQFLNLK
jgi:hypothetical protein